MMEIETRPPAPVAKTPRHRVRNYLLALAVLVVAGGVWAGVWFMMEGGRRADEQRAAESLRKRGMLVITESPLEIIASVTGQEVSHVTSLQFGQTARARGPIDDDAVRQLAALYCLQSLDLTGSKITDDQIRLLGGLPELASLALGDTRVTDAGMVHVARLKQLVALHLATADVGDDGLKPIGQLGELAILNLSRTRVTDAGLKHLAGLDQLRWLLVEHDRITDAAIESIAALKGLRQVSLTGTKVTPAGIARLKKLNPDLLVR